MIPIVGLSGNHSQRYIATNKHRRQHAVLARWIISWTSNSNRSLYHFRVYVIPTCNATALTDDFWKKTILVGSAERWGLCYASCPSLPIVSPGSM